MFTSVKHQSETTTPDNECQSVKNKQLDFNDDFDSDDEVIFYKIILIHENYLKTFESICVLADEK